MLLLLRNQGRSAVFLFLFSRSGPVWPVRQKKRSKNYFGPIFLLDRSVFYIFYYIFIIQRDISDIQTKMSKRTDNFQQKLKGSYVNTWRCIAKQQKNSSKKNGSIRGFNHEG